MFGTYNICLYNINLGLICEDKWYLKKTAIGDEYLQKHNISFEIGIKGNNYIIKDFSNEELICELAQLTCGELKQLKNNTIK